MEIGQKILYTCLCSQNMEQILNSAKGNAKT